MIASKAAFSHFYIWIDRITIWGSCHEGSANRVLLFFQVSILSKKKKIQKAALPWVLSYKANVEFPQRLASAYPEESFQWNINLWESHPGIRLQSNSSSMCKKLFSVWLGMFLIMWSLQNGKKVIEDAWCNPSWRRWMLPHFSLVSVYFCSPQSTTHRQFTRYCHTQDTTISRKSWEGDTRTQSDI